MTATLDAKDKREFLRDFLETLARRLPDSKQVRVDRLFAHLKVSEDEDERREILDSIIEIVSKSLAGRQKPSQAADVQAGVSSDAIQQVEAYRKDIGQRIKIRREELGMTQQELADKSGLPQSHICRLEVGKHAPTNTTIEKIAAALKTEPNQLDLLYH